jgi:hypothetical protein
MTSRILIALVVLSISCSAAFAAAPSVKVEWTGNFSRSHYVRLETVDAKQFLILNQFGQVEETRLPVLKNEMIMGMPPTGKILAQAGEQTVNVHIRYLISDMGGAAFTIELGDEAIRPIHLTPVPQLTIEGRGYYNRSQYVRLETWKEKESTQQFLVLYDFSSATEQRLPVKSNTGEASSTTTKVIEAAGGNRTVRLELGGSRLARVQIDGGEFRPLILLDN